MFWERRAKRRQTGAHELTGIFDQPQALTNYLCHWSMTHRFVYVEVPKAGCTTIKRVLQQAEAGGTLTYERPGIVHDRAHSPLLAPKDDPAGFREALRGGSFCFCFVRNPFTRTLSAYLDKMVANGHERRRLAPKLGLDPDRPPSFAGFLGAVAEQANQDRDIHWKSQAYLLQPNRMRYAYIGRFEALREQIRAVCDHLSIGSYAADLPDTWHATNANSRMREFYGPSEAELVRRIYEEDFCRFGYGWSPDLP